MAAAAGSALSSLMGNGSGPWSALAQVGIAAATKTSSAPSAALSGGMFDASNWNVNFGSGGISSSAKAASETAPATNMLMICAVLLGLAMMVKAWKH